MLVKLGTFIALIIGLLLTPQAALCGDAATIIFDSGQVIRIDDGYRQVMEAMKTLNTESRIHKIVELNIGGGGFLLNVAEVNIVCRDQCAPLTLIHQLDPKRGASQTNVNVNPPDIYIRPRDGLTPGRR